MTAENTDQPPVQFFLTHQQTTDMTRLLVSRMGYLRKAARGEVNSMYTVEEIRYRIRILGEFMNAINRFPTEPSDGGLPVHTFDASEPDLERLNEELTLLYTLIRPEMAEMIVDADVEETAVALSGWTHRIQTKEKCVEILDETLNKNIE